VMREIVIVMFGLLVVVDHERAPTVAAPNAE
jgi:hypothetical protein